MGEYVKDKVSGVVGGVKKKIGSGEQMQWDISFAPTRPVAHLHRTKRLPPFPITQAAELGGSKVEDAKLAANCYAPSDMSNSMHAHHSSHCPQSGESPKVEEAQLNRSFSCENTLMCPHAKCLMHLRFSHCPQSGAGPRWRRSRRCFPRGSRWSTSASGEPPVSCNKFGKAGV